MAKFDFINLTSYFSSKHVIIFVSSVIYYTLSLRTQSPRLRFAQRHFSHLFIDDVTLSTRRLLGGDSKRFAAAFNTVLKRDVTQLNCDSTLWLIRMCTRLQRNLNLNISDWRNENLTSNSSNDNNKNSFKSTLRREPKPKILPENWKEIE